ncbi:hypothetical protein JKF63_01897 [Porcisia hertigi]|uniref:Uncharacterized protein n=1 Tax=Porcisia hertigi TaxID=2761500 RepID=A0A836LB98_9TRYP|nr:hypothetical protein JKF63_01897 [Porcisia hertigi]
MEAYRVTRVTYHTTLAPTIAREENEHVLRIFNAPTHLAAHGKASRMHRTHPRGCLLKTRNQLNTIDFDALRFIDGMTTERLSDTNADKIVYPRHTHATPFAQLLACLIEKLQRTVNTVSWNRPHHRPEWSTDLRFYGPWWLVVRSGRHFTEKRDPSLATSTKSADVSSTAAVEYSSSSATSHDLLFKVHEGKPENQYAPLLVHRSIAEENQLVADIALRLGEKTFKLDLFHLSGVHVSPDRMHVLAFDGFRRLCRSAADSQPDMPLDLLSDEDSLLSTVSLSACQIGSAALLVLLAGIVNLSANDHCHVHSLDLSYNSLTNTSLRCLAQTLRFTKIERLSLRGNVLTSDDPSTLLELLLDGCDREMLELDLSYTALSSEQTSTLIDCLPRLPNLRVLLLEEVTIPFQKWQVFIQAVKKTYLWHVRLLPGPPSSLIARYVRTIEEVCMNNRQQSISDKGKRVSHWSATAFVDDNNSSFFEAFFQISRARGRLPAGAMALPGEYGVFTTNDPSLKVC